MSASSAFRERFFIENLAERYEADGFSVFLHPTREILPPFFGSYQPDAIALKAGKKVAIEIKQDVARQASGVEQIKKVFSEHPEWELRVYYIPERHPEGEDIEAPDVSQIDSALAEIADLERAGHLRAALMMAWAAFEAAGRALLPESLARPQSANQLIEALASEGAVTPTEADSLREAISLRNAATHGRFSVPITNEQVDQVVAAAKLVRGLVNAPSPP
jgi:uncharacterized protein YutE (UPF0331/DUF86 family)